jgi:hypothetical protein
MQLLDKTQDTVTLELTHEELYLWAKALDEYEKQNWQRDDKKKTLAMEMSRYIWRVKYNLYSKVNNGLTKHKTAPPKRAD